MLQQRFAFFLINCLGNACLVLSYIWVYAWRFFYRKPACCYISIFVHNFFDPINRWQMWHSRGWFVPLSIFLFLVIYYAFDSTTQYIFIHSVQQTKMRWCICKTWFFILGRDHELTPYYLIYIVYIHKININLLKGSFLTGSAFSLQVLAPEDLSNTVRYLFNPDYLFVNKKY